MKQNQQNSSKPLRIAIVAGEVSGDILGARLITALRQQHPDCEIIGIPGPEMRAAGCQQIVPMENLAVMGVVEVLAKLPQILRTRRQLLNELLANPPDIYIGVDAPDFNLPVELKLRKAGIYTVHYNSPSVWAWRNRRLKKIAKSTDLMLTLLPFEAICYQQKQIPVSFVGHPLADEIPLVMDKTIARQTLNLPANAKIIALLPGSRANEIEKLAEIFIRTAQQCLAKHPDLIFITPMVNAARREQFQVILQRVAPNLPMQIFMGQSRTLMAAADLILLASGTATLEAMLVKRPMVVAYRFAPITAWLARRLVKIKYFSLPNLLANKELVPEFFQEAVTVENLKAAILQRLENTTLIKNLINEFDHIHHQLRLNASKSATEAILNGYQKVALMERSDIKETVLN